MESRKFELCVMESGNVTIRLSHVWIYIFLKHDLWTKTQRILLDKKSFLVQLGSIAACGP